MLRFSVAQQGAIKALFEKLEPIKRSVGKSRDALTFAQQCLKKNMMASPHDIRGARRLSVIFSLMEVKLSWKQSKIQKHIKSHQFIGWAIHTQCFGDGDAKMPIRNRCWKKSVFGSEGDQLCDCDHPVHPDHPGRHRHGDRCGGDLVYGHSLLLHTWPMPWGKV